MNTNFNCELCSGLCCTVPPELTSRDEVKFARCREFLCEAQNLSVEEILDPNAVQFLPNLLTAPKGGERPPLSKPVFYTRGFVSKYHIPIVSIEEARDRINSVSFRLVLDMLQDTILNVSEHMNKGVSHHGQ